MNIQLQVCGFIMLIMLLIFYKSHKSLNLYAEKVFFRTLFITILTVLFDILSIVCISHSHSLPLFLVKSVCKVYLMFLLWSAWATATYILLDFSTVTRQRWITGISGMFVVLACIVLAFLPISIYNTDNVVYTYGTSVSTTYYLCAICIVGSFVISLILWHHKRSRRSFGGALLTFIWAGAALVQFFNNKLLLVGFSQSLGMLILFVLMENPESYIDKEYGSFNTFGFKPFVDHLYQSRQAFFVAQAFIENNSMLAVAGYDVEEIIRTFISNVSQQADVYVFKDTACSITVLTTNEESFDKCLKIIRDVKQAAPYLKGHAKLVSMRHAEKLSGYDALADLYAHVKSTYINRTLEYVDITDDIIQRHRELNEVNKEIDDALEEDRVEVFLQPIFSNKEKSFTSAEALTRIRMKDGSMLSPGIFIPVAEKTGQIIPLGYRILEKVFEFVSSNDMEALGLHYLEVNLSVMQCEQEDLFENIMAMIQKYKVEPRYINFEITESATINTKDIISANIQKLFDAGFSLSLDDFGKGESNLMYVVDMPVSLMKFDFDLTKAYFDSFKAKSIIRAVVPMAHRLDLKLVSEGVESARELELLSSEGIDYIQGFYFSKPLSMPDFMEFIKTR